MIVTQIARALSHMVSIINKELYRSLKLLTIAVSKILTESGKLATREIRFLLLDHSKDIIECQKLKHAQRL